MPRNAGAQREGIGLASLSGARTALHDCPVFPGLSTAEEASSQDAVPWFLELCPDLPCLRNGLLNMLDVSELLYSLVFTCRLARSDEGSGNIPCDVISRAGERTGDQNFLTK